MARKNKQFAAPNSTNQAAAGAVFENYVNPVGTVRHDDPSAVEHFTRLYSHLQRPSTVPGSTDVHLFRQGIKPVWEDPANTSGGRWILRLPKGLADRIWEHLCLALVGGQFSAFSGTVCGACLGVRYQEDVVSVWTRSCQDVDGNVKVKERLLHVLQLPPSTVMEYKPHETASMN